MSPVCRNFPAGTGADAELLGRKNHRHCKRQSGVSRRRSCGICGCGAFREGTDCPNRLLRKSQRADSGFSRRAVRRSFRLRRRGYSSGERDCIAEQHCASAGLQTGADGLFQRLPISQPSGAESAAGHCPENLTHPENPMYVPKDHSGKADGVPAGAGQAAGKRGICDSL